MSGVWARVKVEFDGTGAGERAKCLAALEGLPQGLYVSAMRHEGRWRGGEVSFTASGEGLVFQGESELREGDAEAMRAQLAKKWPRVTVKWRNVEVDEWDAVLGPAEKD